MRHALRPALTGLLAMVVAGCGSAPLAGPLLRGEAGLGAMADVPGIDAQIAKEKLGEDETGIQVRALPKPGQAKPVTLLTYKALDNNLGLLVGPHLNVLERAGSSRHVNALAMIDDIGPNNTRRYYMRQDGDRQNVTSPYEAIGERNTGSGATLTESVRWAFGSYPSRLRWLDINSHGGGYKGVAQDDEADALLSLPTLGKALRAGAGAKPLDVLSFDACLMATLEVAFELKDAARYMVASEDESYAVGLNVDRVLAELGTKGAPEAEALARTLVVRAQKSGKDTVRRGTQKTNKAFYTISALDLSKAQRVTTAMDQLAGALLAAMPTDGAAIRMAVAGARPFYVTSHGGDDFEQRDLHELLDQLKLRVKDPGVRAAAQAVNETLFNRNGIVLLSRAAVQEQKVPRGLSIYAPATGKVDPEYRASAFAQSTRWDEFLATL